MTQLIRRPPGVRPYQLASCPAEDFSADLGLDAVRDRQRHAGLWRTARDLCGLELLGAVVGVNLLVRAAADSVAAATPGWWQGPTTRPATPG